jgi:hypothetical protein
VIAANTATAYRIAFAADALTFLAAALLPAIPATSRLLSGADGAATGDSVFAVFRDRGYVLVGTFNMLLTLHIPLIDVAFPLWIVQHTAAPDWIIGAVFVVNTALVVVPQYRESTMMLLSDALQGVGTMPPSIS